MCKSFQLSSSTSNSSRSHSSFEKGENYHQTTRGLLCSNGEIRRTYEKGSLDLFSFESSFIAVFFSFQIREYLVNRKSEIENREKLRKLREQRLYGKKVQQEVLQKRQEDKSNLLKTMKKVRKGKKGGMQELEESLGDRKRSTSNQHGGAKKNRKAEYKNKKFGFGGQKKNSKKNTAESSADVFNKKSSKWQRPSFHAQKGKKVRLNSFPFSSIIISFQGKGKQSRPGKNARQKARTKK